jgi:ATP-binding cassette subfamily B protein
MALLSRIMRFDMRGRWLLLLLALFALALSVPAEAVLFRSLLSIRPKLALPYQLGTGVALLLAFVLLGLWLELFASSLTRRLGMGLEARLRVGLCEKLPRLEDNYLRTRPSSDMAARAHSLHHLREVPVLLVQAVRALLTMIALGAGLVWLHPRAAVLVLGAGLLSLALPFAARRQVSETGMRLRTHGAQLDGFFLDALLGVSPIRVHGAERAVRTAHEELLTEWGRTARTLHRQNTVVQALSLALSTGLAALLVIGYVRERADLGGLLLFAFWAFRLPAVAQELVLAELGLRSLRSVALRALAPLGATELPAQSVHSEHASTPGMALAFEQVVVRVSGHTLLHETSLELEPGSHVAIVGASGAGKSSLLGLLLGWSSPCAGRVLVDGKVLTPERLASVREQTAWIDPGVQLRDASLLDNLMFGVAQRAELTLPGALACADLFPVLEQLPEGMQTELGENGARLSGGQGQRVRLARAAMRRDARLVLLDEPFRGLPREQRLALLARVREHFRHATLLFVSHDVADVADFARVLVVDGGRVVEDGSPAQLAAKPESRYARLARSDQLARQEVWGAGQFRRHVLEAGRVTERGQA